MSGSKLMRAEKGKKLQEVIDTKYNLFKNDHYIIARDANENHFNVFNVKSEEISTLKLDFTPHSLFKTEKGYVATTSDRKLIISSDGLTKKDVSIGFDNEARIVNVKEGKILVAVSSKTQGGQTEPSLNVYDLDGQLVSQNKFLLRETDEFAVNDVVETGLIEGTGNYMLLGHTGANIPIVLKKINDQKYIQPRLHSDKANMISNFGEVRVQDNFMFIGNGRKIYKLGLTETKTESKPKVQIKQTKEAQLILTELYKDQISRVRRVGIETKQQNADLILTKLTPNPQNLDMVYVAKNNKNHETTIMRYNFNTNSDLEVVTEIDKPNRQSYIVDMVVTADNKINGIDNLGYYYVESTGDKMV